MNRIGFFLGLILTASAAPTWQGDLARGAAQLEQQWRLIADSSRPLPIRGTLRFAVEAAGLNWHPERVEAALARARAMQDLKPGSRTFGNFQWRGDQKDVLDLNAVEFASQLMGLLHRQYRDRLSPAARQLLETMMGDAVAGLRSHTVRIEYTNITLMKAWDLIALGEALARPDVADDGYRRFDEWLRFTAQNGVGEFGAVTYYGVDFDSLAFIARLAERPDAQAKALAAMRYLWTDVAANWWSPGDRMAGANSRSYDYLFGGGYLEAHTWTAGWLRERPVLESAGWLGADARDDLVAFQQAATFPPPADWTEKIRAAVPRMVAERWGPDRGQRAFAWIGHQVTLASAGAAHGADDRTFVANLGDSPAIAQVTIFMDGRGDPFGTKHDVMSAGHAKALHLIPFIAAVQHGPEVLQVLSFDPRVEGARKPNPECLLTQITVPAQAELWSGDRRLTPGTLSRPCPVSLDAPLCIRVGDAAVAIRVVSATMAGAAVAAEFVEEQRKAPARRLTLIHSATKPAGRGTVVLWARAAEGLDDAAFHRWRSSFASAATKLDQTGDNLAVEVAGADRPLRIEADLARGDRTTLAGGESDALLSVNGIDLGRAILGPFCRD